MDGVGSYTCMCLQGYRGQFCEIAPVNVPFPNFPDRDGVCRDHDCQNNGVCYQPKNSQEYMCQCAPGEYMSNIKYFSQFLFRFLMEIVLGLLYISNSPVSNIDHACKF